MFPMLKTIVDFFKKSLYHETMRYFTSDLHLGHRLVSRLRGFEDTVAHDNHVVSVWNSLIKPEDETWVLGDVTLKKIQQVADTIARLNGRIKVVLGNHDTAHMMMKSGWETQWALANELFDFIGTQSAIKVDGSMILMNHFPYKQPAGENYNPREDRFDQWRFADNGLFLLHGHTHSNTKDQYPNSLHVGWDAWGKPVTESQVMQKYKQWKNLKLAA